MKKVKISRVKKFASALVPFWVVTDMSKTEFMKTFGLGSDRECKTVLGQAAPRIAGFEPDKYGVRIANGETLELEVADEKSTLFVMTMDGLLSNEIALDKAECRVEIGVKGGMMTPSYPVARLL